MPRLRHPTDWGAQAAGCYRPRFPPVGLPARFWATCRFLGARFPSGFLKAGRLDAAAFFPAGLPDFSPPALAPPAPAPVPAALDRAIAPWLLRFPPARPVSGRLLPAAPREGVLTTPPAPPPLVFDFTLPSSEPPAVPAPAGSLRPCTDRSAEMRRCASFSFSFFPVAISSFRRP